MLSVCDVSNVALSICGGNNGKLLEELLMREGVKYSFTHTNCETRTNYKIFDSLSGETTDINEKGARLSEDTLVTFYENLKNELADTAILVIAGSVPTGCDMMIYKNITKLAKEYDVKVIADADGELLKNVISASPFALKPNIHELEELFMKKITTEAEIINAARQLIENGIELVCVSLGGDGAIYITKDEVIKTEPLRLGLKSTVGCGDSVVGAMAYCIVKGYELEELAKISTAAGSVTASLDGTSICNIKEAIKKADLVKAHIIY